MVLIDIYHGSRSDAEHILVESDNVKMQHKFQIGRKTTHIY